MVGGGHRAYSHFVMRQILQVRVSVYGARERGMSASQMGFPAITLSWACGHGGRTNNVLCPQPGPVPIPSTCPASWPRSDSAPAPSGNVPPLGTGRLLGCHPAHCKGWSKQLWRGVPCVPPCKKSPSPPPAFRCGRWAQLAVGPLQRGLLAASRISDPPNR